MARAKARSVGKKINQIFFQNIFFFFFELSNLWRHRGSPKSWFSNEEEKEVGRAQFPVANSVFLRPKICFALFCVKMMWHTLLSSIKYWLYSIFCDYLYHPSYIFCLINAASVGCLRILFYLVLWLVLKYCCWNSFTKLWVIMLKFSFWTQPFESENIK